MSQTAANRLHCIVCVLNIPHTHCLYSENRDASDKPATDPTKHTHPQRKQQTKLEKMNTGITANGRNIVYPTRNVKPAVNMNNKK